MDQTIAIILAIVGVLVFSGLVFVRPPPRPGEYERGRQHVKDRMPLTEEARVTLEVLSDGTFGQTDFDRGVQDELRAQYQGASNENSSL